MAKRLTEEQIQEELEKLRGWAREGNAIRKQYTLGGFPDAIAFVARLAFDAEAADHHPDSTINFKRVTLVFSTHQLDMAEELCDTVAIIDHGRLVTAGATRDVKRSTGHQVVRLATSTDGDLDWLRSLPHVQVTRPGRDFTELHVDAGSDPQVILRAAVGRGDEVLRFEVADPSLEEVFVERVGALDVEERTLAAPEEAKA
jgi:pterin-4a-carbinolamine dehydratase